MLRVTLISIVLFNFHLCVSQTNRGDSLTHKYNTEGPSKLLTLEILSYIHYEGAATNNRPEYTLFFIDQEKSYQLQTSRQWQYKEENEIILEEMDFVESCELESEEEFNELNINWLNKQLDLSVDSMHANLVYYNKNDSLGYIKVYKLKMKEK